MTEKTIHFFLPLDDAKRHIKQLLCDQTTNAHTHPYNAFTHSDQGRIQALQDILNLIEMFGCDFKSQAALVAENKIKSKRPNYNPCQDKMNADAHWAYAYAETMKMFGVQVAVDHTTNN